MDYPSRYDDLHGDEDEIEQEIIHLKELKADNDDWKYTWEATSASN